MVSWAVFCLSGHVGICHVIAWQEPHLQLLALDNPLGEERSASTGLKEKLIDRTETEPASLPDLLPASPRVLAHRPWLMRHSQSPAPALGKETVVSSATATSWAFGGLEHIPWVANADLCKCWVRDHGLPSCNLCQPTLSPGQRSDGSNKQVLAEQSAGLPPLGGIS